MRSSGTAGSPIDSLMLWSSCFQSSDPNPKVVCSLSLKGFYQQCFGVPSALPSSLPFPSPSDFRCGEPVGESERGRPFPVPFLSGSCLNAHASPHEHWPFCDPTDAISPRSCLCHVICLFPSLFRCSEVLLQACPRLDFSL